MNDLLLNIISNTLGRVRADLLLQHALETEKLTGDFHLLAIGKAACPMALAAQKSIAGKILTALVITRKGYGEAIPGMRILEAAHPYPDETSLYAGQQVMDFVTGLKRGDRLLLLISGGASALVEMPLPGVSLAEISKITIGLQKAGADIIELNAVRKHLSQLKGGRLAKLAEPAQIYSFLLSDVPGDRIDTIASGPAAPDGTTSASALSILRNYHIPVTENIENAIRNETPKELRNVVTRLIGNNELLCQIVAEKIMAEGYIPWLLTTSMEGEASHYARMIPDIVHKARHSKGEIQLPCIAICGGETTVTVKGKGKGGRNLEMALTAAINIRNLKGVTVATCASDGADGNTELTGAIIDTNSYNKMLSAGVTPEISLHNNDAWTALERIDATYSLAPTATNLNDLLLILIEKT
ncbi:MAG: DUF4147 domain-containing protein [Candidatus Cloacimonetes bacterium]|nr:DUF4147 domain-containing protein [Candidatus Cloacimonadota bacterium]